MTDPIPLMEAKHKELIDLARQLNREMRTLTKSVESVRDALFAEAFELKIPLQMEKMQRRIDRLRGRVKTLKRLYLALKAPA